MRDQKKKKKPKTVYIDDGRTICDMSALDRARGKSSDTSLAQPKQPSQGRVRASVKEQLRTYFEAVKMMLLPMLVVLGVISVAFFIMWLLTQ